MNLKLESPLTYEGAFPHFSEPLEIGHFSQDSDRNYCNDAHQLKYIIMPPSLTHVHMDLNEGYSNVIRKDFGKKEKIDTILKWIVSHPDEIKKYFRDNSGNSK